MPAVETRTRRRLDRRQVLEAALAIVDREGLDALSMRRLGAELGADPMAAYHHVGEKDRLHAGIAELLWEEVVRPSAGDDPIEALRALARSLRDLFRRHPAAAPLILRCAPLSASQLELFRAYLDVLAERFADPAAVLRPVISYALGSGYTESTMLGGGQCGSAQRQVLSERDLLLSLGQALPAGTPPELASAAVTLIADCDPDRCFSDGLDLMLVGLGAMAGESRARRTQTSS